VSQTLFIVVINDRLEAIKHGWFGTFKNQSKLKITIFDINSTEVKLG
jgi:hypothetical protein